uniref:Ig-like domain-containing protein n=1 Tax=Xiphophorus couchianus TaxID=32473 RepID=A0A3B5L5S7_9TELE
MDSQPVANCSVCHSTGACSSRLLVTNEMSGDATIDCSHKKGPSYFQMYWFRQLPGKTMELVVFTTAGSSKHDFGSFSQEKFSATKAEAESGALTVKSLEPADEGLYFCAVSSAQRCRRAGRLNKNPGSQRRLTVVWTAGGSQSAVCSFSSLHTHTHKEN